LTIVRALQLTLLFAARVVLHAAAFGASFFLFAIFAGIAYLDGRSPDPIGFVAYVIVVTILSVGTGAITGGVFALLPLRARDVCIAMALGAGVVLAVLMQFAGGLELLWTVVAMLTAAVAASSAAWLCRRVFAWAG
jgi:hypothetical protein